MFLMHVYTYNYTIIGGNERQFIIGAKMPMPMLCNYTCTFRLIYRPHLGFQTLFPPSPEAIGLAKLSWSDRSCALNRFCMSDEGESVRIDCLTLFCGCKLHSLPEKRLPETTPENVSTCLVHPHERVARSDEA